MTKRATPHEPSHIIVTASIAGIGIGATGKNSVPAYTASKAGVIQMARHLAVDLGPKNIRCNAIAPGFFPSKMASGLMEMLGGTKKLAQESPDGRVGIPDDIAGAVVYLSSRASNHVNGGVIALDGGVVWSRSSL